MKRAMSFLILICLTFLVACGNDTTVFTAYVLETGDTILVEPLEESNEAKS